MEGFDVYEDVQIENIDEVRQVKNVIPPTSGVKLRINRVKPEWNKEKDTAMLSVSLQIVDGIETLNTVTGENELKYQGAMATNFPVRVMYYVAPAKLAEKANHPKKSTANWWKNKQYLVEFRQLLIAVGIDPKLEEFKSSEGRLNVDSLVTALKDRELIGDIKEVQDEAFDKSTGEKTKLDTTHNEVKNFRKLA